MQRSPPYEIFCEREISPISANRGHAEARGEHSSFYRVIWLANKRTKVATSQIFFRLDAGKDFYDLATFVFSLANYTIEWNSSVLRAP